MTSVLSLLSLASALASPLDAAPAVELRYAGTVAPVARDGVGEPTKRFGLYCLAVNADDGGRTLTYVVDEQGAGGWAWPERSGTLELDRTGKPIGDAAIRVLYDHQGTANPLAIVQPIFEFGDEELAEGAEWISGKYAYQVTRRRKLGERTVWQIDGANNFGRRKRLHVAVDEPLVISAEQRVFMGRGDQFELRIELESIEALDASRLDAFRKPAATLAELRTALARRGNATAPELSAEQLTKAEAYVTRLTAEAEGTPFERLASAIARDVKAQQQRVDDVESLAKKFVGQPAPALALESLGGGELKAEVDGKVAVLHFWKYHEEPLKEPYGQVGYLDFLDNQNRRRKLDVPVFGIAVDPRFGKASEARAAQRQVRHFLEFMNVGYPVARDDGTLLKTFGDPRSVGAELPLWVVIGADGKIALHKSGYWDINPDEGLKALESTVFEQVRKARAKSE